jgi:hypothetical protein
MPQSGEVRAKLANPAGRRIIQKVESGRGALGYYGGDEYYKAL